MADTGANTSCMSLDLANRQGINFTRRTKDSVQHAGGEPLPVQGKTYVRFQLEDADVTTKVLIVKGLGTDVLLDDHSSMIIGIIPKSFPQRMPPCHHCNNRHENIPSKKSTVEASKVLGKVFKTNEKETGFTLTKNLKRQYKDVISDQLNETPMAGKPMHIYLTEGPMLPTRVTTARAVPKNMERAAIAAVEDLLKKKVITKVETPTDWCSPCLLYTSPSPRDGLLSRMPSSA